MIGKVITIASWVIKVYENAKVFIKTKYRAHRSRKIRNAVDKRNTAAIKRIVQDIIHKRREKQDSV